MVNMHFYGILCVLLIPSLHFLNSLLGRIARHTFKDADGIYLLFDQLSLQTGNNAAVKQ